MSASGDTLYTAADAGPTFAVAALTREPASGGLGEAPCAAFMGVGGIAGCGSLPGWVGSLALGLPTLSVGGDVLLAGFDELRRRRPGHRQRRSADALSDHGRARSQRPAFV